MGGNIAPKSHKCPECGSTFTRAFSLKMHMNTHTGERPFRCDVCGDTFLRHHDRKMHAKRHTGEKPYRCEDCGQTFTRTSALKSHRENTCRGPPRQIEEDSMSGASHQSTSTDPSFTYTSYSQAQQLPFQPGVFSQPESTTYEPSQSSWSLSKGLDDMTLWTTSAGTQVGSVGPSLDATLANMIEEPKPQHIWNLPTSSKQTQNREFGGRTPPGTGLVDQTVNPPKPEISLAVQSWDNWIQLVGRARYPECWYTQAWFTAARYGAIFALQYLHEKESVDINVKDSVTGGTALHLAALDSRANATEWLIRCGADVNAQDKFGQTPLHCALHSPYNRQASVVDLLITAEADVDMKNKEGYTPLHYALRYHHNDRNNLACIRKIAVQSRGIQEKYYYGTLLHYAIVNSSAIVLRLFLRSDLDVNEENQFGQKPLDLACRLGKENHIQELLDNAKSISLIDKDGRSPFHNLYAKTWYWNYEVDHTKSIRRIIHMLMEHGIDLDAVDNLGSTPLHHHMHAMTHGNYPAKQVVRSLIMAGADLYAPDSWNRSPMDVANGYITDYKERQTQQQKSGEGDAQNTSDEFDPLDDFLEISRFWSPSGKAAVSPSKQKPESQGGGAHQGLPPFASSFLLPPLSQPSQSQFNFFGEDDHDFQFQNI